MHTVRFRGEFSYVTILGTSLAEFTIRHVHTVRIGHVVDEPFRIRQRHQVEQLLAHLDELAAGGDARAVRDVAIVRLLHGAAFRRFEALGLRVADVQLEHPDGACVWPLRKGHRERERMLIGPLAAESLRRWLAIRGTTR